MPADPDQGRVRGQREARRVLVVRRAVQVPGAAQPEAAEGLRLMFLRGPGGGHQHPRTLRRALQLLPGRALGGGEVRFHTLGVGGAVDQGAGTLEVGLLPGWGLQELTCSDGQHLHQPLPAPTRKVQAFGLPYHL